MAWLWFCGYEGGPVRDEVAALGAKARSHLHQDCWGGGSESVDTGYTIQDGDAGADVHCGRYAVRLVGLGFGDLAAFRGHALAITTKPVVFSVRHQQIGFDSAPVAADLNSYYGVAACWKDQISPPANAAVEITFKLVSISPLKMVYTVHLNNTLKITGTTQFDLPMSSGSWNWVQVSVDGSGNLELFVNDTSEGTGSGATGTLEPYILPEAVMLAGGKGSGDKSARHKFCDMGVSDSASPDPTTRPASSTVIIGHQPVADVSGEDGWTGDPDASNQYRNWDDENDDCAVAADKNSPPSVGATQVSEIANAPGSPTIQAVRIMYATAEMPTLQIRHTLRLNVGSGFQEYTNPLYGFWNTAASPYEMWVGQHFAQTPEATPQNWTLALFNALQAGVKAVDTTRHVCELYAIAIGTGLTRPAKTPCPPAAAGRSQVIII